MGPLNVPTKALNRDSKRLLKIDSFVARSVWGGTLPENLYRIFFLGGWNPALSLTEKLFWQKNSKSTLDINQPNFLSFQIIVVPRKMYSLTRNPMVISRRPGEAQIGQLYGQNKQKWVYKKWQKCDFGHKSIPDRFPDLENIYPGVVGHAESNFDGTRAPKYSKICVFRGPRIRFFWSFMGVHLRRPSKASKVDPNTVFNGDKMEFLCVSASLWCAHADTRHKQKKKNWI